MTDIEKYKSVAVKIDCYQKAKPMAEEKYMSIGSFIRYLIDKEYETQKTNGKDHTDEHREN
jgi:hydroxyethylthiazole kinase-like sugar kinase family protein